MEKRLKKEKRKMKPIRLSPGMKKFLSFLVGLFVGVGTNFVPPEYREMVAPMIDVVGDEIQNAIEDAPEPEMSLELPEVEDSDSDK